MIRRQCKLLSDCALVISHRCSLNTTTVSQWTAFHATLRVCGSLIIASWGGKVTLTCLCVAASWAEIQYKAHCSEGVPPLTVLHYVSGLPLAMIHRIVIKVSHMHDISATVPQTFDSAGTPGGLHRACTPGSSGAHSPPGLTWT